MDLSEEERLAVLLFVTVFIVTCETIGGILSNSLALLSDAGHMATDALAIALSLVASRFDRKRSDRKATFGYRRIGLLAALFNGMSLLVIAVYIFYESYERLLSPPDINIPVMLGIATFGLAGNLIMVLILGHRHEDPNIKSVWLHILGDTLSSVGVIISGIIIYFTGWLYADPLAGIIIGGIIIWGGVRLVRDTLAILLDFAPKGLNVEILAKNIAALPDVLSVHDVHLWSVAHNYVAFSAHVLVREKRLEEVQGTKRQIERILGKAGVDHSTLQIEHECTENSNGLYCEGGMTYKKTDTSTDDQDAKTPSMSGNEGR